MECIGQKKKKKRTTWHHLWEGESYPVGGTTPSGSIIQLIVFRLAIKMSTHSACRRRRSWWVIRIGLQTAHTRETEAAFPSAFSQANMRSHSPAGESPVHTLTAFKGDRWWPSDFLMTFMRYLHFHRSSIVCLKKKKKTPHLWIHPRNIALKKTWSSLLSIQ